MFYRRRLDCHLSAGKDPNNISQLVASCYLFVMHNNHFHAFIKEALTNNILIKIISYKIIKFTIIHTTKLFSTMIASMSWYANVNGRESRVITLSRNQL